MINSMPRGKVRRSSCTGVEIRLFWSFLEYVCTHILRTDHVSTAISELPPRIAVNRKCLFCRWMDYKKRPSPRTGKHSMPMTGSVKLGHLLTSRGSETLDIKRTSRKIRQTPSLISRHTITLAALPSPPFLAGILFPGLDNFEVYSFDGRHD